MIDKVTDLKRIYEGLEKGILNKEEKADTYFLGLLKETFKKLNSSQLEADSAINSFLKGEITDIHKVLITLEKASLTLRFAMQVRNKIVEAYQEIMRMQL